MRSTIKVLVVDDSALIRQMLTRALSADPAVEVVGSARTGIEAIEKARDLQPDVVTLDIEMPELSGLEALPHIIRATPARVVMLSAFGDSDTTYQALDQGATDFMVKPAGGFASALPEIGDELLQKIKTAYRVAPERRTVGRDRRPTSGVHARPAAAPRARTVDRLVAIAASTGGPPALETVFSGLTADLPAAYVIVQHLPAGFTMSLARRLARVTDIGVVEAGNRMPLEQGMAYLAPYGSHTLVSTTRPAHLTFDDSAPLHGVRPAADPLMQSVAEVFGARAVGVVLTGMGADGARGLGLIHDAGGEAIVQDEASSVVWGMPGAAVRAGAASKIVSLDAVASEIRRALRR